MNITHLTVSSLFLAATVALGGCTAATSEDIASDSFDSVEAALSARTKPSGAAARLVGSYVGESSNRSYPVLGGLVLASNGTFFSDADTGIRCIQAPCPSNVRMSGTFTATATKLNLRASGSSVDSVYSYTLKIARNGEKVLKLDQVRFDANWTNTLKSAPSYCRTTLDCKDLAVPAVLGAELACMQNACTIVNAGKCRFTLCAPDTRCEERPETAIGVACVPVAAAEPVIAPACLRAICAADTTCVEKLGTPLGFDCVAR
jgi:hypothetical protein